MNEYKILKVYKIDKLNGFKVGQIVCGRMHTVQCVDKNLGETYVEILLVKDSPYGLKSSQVKQISDVQI